MTVSPAKKPATAAATRAKPTTATATKTKTTTKAKPKTKVVEKDPRAVSATVPPQVDDALAAICTASSPLATSIRGSG